MFWQEYRVNVTINLLCYILVQLWGTERVHVVAKTLREESHTDLKLVYEVSSCEHGFEYRNRK